jgi:hypothetical protein
MTHVAADGAGNVVVAGHFRGGITFEETNYQESGMLLAKIAPSGDVIWHRVLPGLILPDAALAGLAIHRPTGDIILFGSFTSTVDLGGPNPLQLPAGDVRDAYVARLGPEGTWKWQRHIKASDDEEHVLGGVAVDGAGEVYVTGAFTTSMDLGDGAISSASQEVFVARLSSESGLVVWKKKVGGVNGSHLANAIAVDAFDHLVIGGEFSGQSNFGSVPLMASGVRDGFVVAYSANSGNFRWQKQIGGTGDDSVRSLAIDANPQVYVGLSFSAVAGETMMFAGSPVVGTGGSATEIVIGALGAQNANVVWARRYGSSGMDAPQAVTILADSSVGVVGHYGGDIIIGTTTLPHAGGPDGLLVRMSSSGSPTFAGRVSSGAADLVVSIAGTSTAVVTTGRIAAQASVFGKTVTPVGGTDGIAASLILPP